MGTPILLLVDDNAFNLDRLRVHLLGMGYHHLMYEPSGDQPCTPWLLQTLLLGLSFPCTTITPHDSLEVALQQLAQAPLKMMQNVSMCDLCVRPLVPPSCGSRRRHARHTDQIKCFEQKRRLALMNKGQLAIKVILNLGRSLHRQKAHRVSCVVRHARVLPCHGWTSTGQPLEPSSGNCALQGLTGWPRGGA